MTQSWFLDELTGSVSRRFERVASRVPDLDAVAGTHGRLTYGELREHARALAARITAAVPVAPARVAVLCGADTLRIVATMGVLAAGRTVVILDGRSPTAWNAQLVSDSRASALIFDGDQEAQALELAGQASASAVALIAIRDGDRDARAAVDPVVDGRDLAAIVYTSGSTHRPKGVMRPHDSFLHTAWLHSELGGVSDGQRIGSIASAGFARAIHDGFTALLNGACLCIYDFGRRGIAGLGEWLAAERVTSLNLPIAVAREWCASSRPLVRVPALRDIRFSGAAAQRRDVEQLAATLVGDWRVWAQYSSSEVGSVARTPARRIDELPEGTLHVGTPVSGRTVTLLGVDGCPVPAGERGEVVVSGHFLATGYWDNPELTRARFEALGDGRTRYRTGDLGILDAGGNLCLVGRSDDTVKIRGFSVAPADIEALLLAWPRVAQAAVLPVADPLGGRELAAYVVPVAADTVTDSDVRNLVAQARPSFMVPRHVTVLERMPMLDNGKTNRDALRRLVQSAAPPTSPAGGTTLDTVQRAWRDVLGGDCSRVDATFLELGGDSFAVARLERRLSELFERRLELTGLIAQPTISDQAAWIDRLLAGHDERAASPARVRLLADRPGREVIYMLPATDGTLTYALQFARAATTLLVCGVDPPLRADGSFDAVNLQDLAHSMAGCIATHAQGRPVSLMGPCGGGKVGLEVAAFLQSAGATIEKVVVVEAPGIADRGRWTPAAAADIASWFWQAVRTLASEAVSSGVSRPFIYAGATGRIVLHAITRPRAQRGTLQERKRSLQFRAMSQVHERSTYPFPVLLIRGAWSQLGLQLAGSGPGLGWHRHCPDLSIRFAPGTHTSMYQAPFVEALTRIVEEDRMQPPT